MKKEEFSYEKTMRDLEEIVNRIDSGDCKIDELTEEIKKAKKLIALCKTKLQKIDEEVKGTLE